jgi:hypothetical protein
MGEMRRWGEVQVKGERAQPGGITTPPGAGLELWIRMWGKTIQFSVGPWRSLCVISSFGLKCKRVRFPSALAITPHQGPMPYPGPRWKVVPLPVLRLWCESFSVWNARPPFLATSSNGSCHSLFITARGI